MKKLLTIIFVLAVIIGFIYLIRSLFNQEEIIEIEEGNNDNEIVIEPIESNVAEVSLSIVNPFSKVSIIINNSREIKYEAQDYTKPEIEIVTDSIKILEKDYLDLVEFISGKDFFSLKDQYIEQGLMDATFYTIRVQKDDEIKAVSCYGQPCPEEVLEIIEKIKELWPNQILEIGV